MQRRIEQHGMQRVFRRAMGDLGELPFHRGTRGDVLGLLLGPIAGIVRPAVAVTAAHLVWWVAVIGIELYRADPSFDPLHWLAMLEPAVFAGSAIVLGIRWFRYLRRTRPA